MKKSILFFLCLGLLFQPSVKAEEGGGKLRVAAACFLLGMVCGDIWASSHPANKEEEKSKENPTDKEWLSRGCSKPQSENSVGDLLQTLVIDLLFFII